MSGDIKTRIYEKQSGRNKFIYCLKKDKSGCTEMTYLFLKVYMTKGVLF
jgi:hypothetical protein